MSVYLDFMKEDWFDEVLVFMKLNGSWLILLLILFKLLLFILLKPQSYQIIKKRLEMLFSIPYTIHRFRKKEFYKAMYTQIYRLLTLLLLVSILLWSLSLIIPHL